MDVVMDDTSTSTSTSLKDDEPRTSAPHHSITSQTPRWDDDPHSQDPRDAILRKYYRVSRGDGDVVVMQAPNEVCVVALCRNHELVERKIVKVEFFGKSTANDWDAACGSGKRKRGARTVQKGQNMCKLHYDGGCVEIKAPLAGKVIDINKKLIASPQLATAHPTLGGYLLVIQPHQKFRKRKRSAETTATKLPPGDIMLLEQWSADHWINSSDGDCGVKADRTQDDQSVSEIGSM